MRALLVCCLAALPLASVAEDGEALARKSGCFACHRADKDGVGPAYRRVARRYANVNDARVRLAESITRGGVGRWGSIPMPPRGNNAKLGSADILALAGWIARGAPSAAKP